MPSTAQADRTARNQAAAKARYEIGNALHGHALGQAVKVMAKDATFTDQDSFIDWLTAGPTVTVTCSAAPRAPWRPHRVTVNRDGSLTLHDHEGIDLEGERVMSALAGHMPACIAAALCIPNRETAPGWFRGGRQSLDSRLRVLHAAVMWAQEPNTDWAWLKQTKLITEAVTPAVVQQWTEAGFTVAQAFPFWATMARLDTALVWLAVGDTSKRAAICARDGVLPDADGPWLAAGFNRSSATAWRNLGALDPAEAFEWSRRGFGVHDWRLIDGPRARFNTAGLTREVAFAWADAGIHGTHVSGWFTATQGDLDTAVAWARTGLAVSAVQFVQNPMQGYRTPAGQWMSRRVGEPMTVRRVQEWSDAGFPMKESHLLVAVNASGLSPLSFARAANHRPVSQRAVRPLVESLLGSVPTLT